MADIPYYLKPIHLKPSAELIPDEYKVPNSKHFFVQIIHDNKFANDADLLAETLGERCCKLSVSKVLFTDNKGFFEQLDTFKKKLTNHTKGVFTIVLCNGSKREPGKLISAKGEEGITFSEVWDDFIKLQCLNRKPKLFLFQTYISHGYEFDGMHQTRRLYNVPAPGADLLLIARSVELAANATDLFIKHFCKHIHESGDFADIVEIATFSTTDQRPLIVSTLTARYFLKNAAFRDINHMILRDLKDMHEECKKNKNVIEIK